MVGQMASCVQEFHHLEQRLLLRHFIFSLATYHTTEAYSISDSILLYY